jgi:hypothetical protein
MSDTLELTNPKIQQALDELKGLILAHYPGAQFRVSRGQDDPAAIHLVATVDVEDTEDVVNLTIEREQALQIDEGLPIFVIPIQPLERVVTRWEARLKKRTAQPAARP